MGVFLKLIGLALSGALAAVAGPNDTLPAATKAVPADDWSVLFARKSGWTGADGIFSIPLSGYEGPDHAEGQKTLFVFSDTFIGSVDATGARKGALMVNNSLAILDGAVPDSSKIRFLWGRNDKGVAASAFIPNTPSTAGKTDTWYWLQDGFCRKGYVYDLPLIVQRNDADIEGFKFKEIGIGLLKIPLDSKGEPDLAHAEQKDTPLFHTGTKSFYFGCGILVNTKEAGAPDPDDSIYVYGRNGLYVARVLADEFEDFSKWRYWDGKGWNPDIAQSVSLGLGGPEMSVMPILTGALNGKYVMISMGIGKDLYMRIGDGPAGPFGAKLNFAKALESDSAKKIYTYNAKAHPSLSGNGDWLVSYNVNSPDWDVNLANADIYHPRFLRLRFDPATALAPFTKSPGRYPQGAMWNGSEAVITGTKSWRRLDGRKIRAQRLLHLPEAIPK